VDPTYLDAPYYIYPDGKLAAVTFRVTRQAIAHSNKVGLGRGDGQRSSAKPENRYLSSQTSSMRLLLKRLSTMIVSPLT
jgi:hypothetical protein